MREVDTLRTTLSTVLSLDYLGALVAALLFPYVLLPFLGTLHTGLVAGLANSAVGLGVVFAFKGWLAPREYGSLIAQAVFVLFLLLGLAWQSEGLLDRWESDLYDDQIVHSEQSKYQKIVMTRRGHFLRLYLNGHLQFASVDEHRYHEALVHPALSMVSNRERVLIIGGGDGLTAREVQKYADVRQIDLVDLDPAVTHFGPAQYLHNRAQSKRPK